MGRKVRHCCDPFGGGVGSTSNTNYTMWPGSMTKWHLDPSNRLAAIHQRHRQTGQRSDSIGQTVLQTVAQKGSHLLLSVTSSNADRLWIAFTDGLIRIDWLSCGLSSHSTQNRSFRRRSQGAEANLLAWYGKTKPNTTRMWANAQRDPVATPQS